MLLLLQSPRARRRRRARRPVRSLLLEKDAWLACAPTSRGICCRVMLRWVAGDSVLLLLQSPRARRRRRARRPVRSLLLHISQSDLLALESTDGVLLLQGPRARRRRRARRRARPLLT